MADILKVSNTSSQNTEDFIATLGDRTLAELLKRQLEHILLVGKLESGAQGYDRYRDDFYEAVEQLIDARTQRNED